ncbi:unnamed protein product [Heligmosomoides polygyrus]|uniref:DUF4388 domain-containing protein n=1 Tax=Heligmosomoides polygyrus TaxID=6339 RepID=A0A183FCF3_HELPZ|nr:unnamed protein product [Heligmosomoides polygyrus]
MFDVNLCGYLNERDLEDIIFNSELGVTRAQMAKMSHKLMSREKINYRHLTDVLVDSDGNVRFSPGECENAPEIETLLRGFGLQAFKGILEPQTNGDVHRPCLLYVLQKAETSRQLWPNIVSLQFDTHSSSDIRK